MALLLVLLTTLTLRPADNGRTFSVAPRTKIVLVLPSNRSTGYRWGLTTRPSPSVVRLVSHRYVAPTTNQPGAAGKEIWRFTAVGHGAARVGLAYSQYGQVARRFRIALHVR